MRSGSLSAGKYFESRLSLSSLTFISSCSDAIAKHRSLNVYTSINMFYVFATEVEVSEKLLKLFPSFPFSLCAYTSLSSLSGV